MFVKHGGIGIVKTQPGATSSSIKILTVEQLKSTLSKAGVWIVSVPGNIESWHPEILVYVQGGHFTFQEFVKEFSNNVHLGYGATLRRLLHPAPQCGGGWLKGVMN